MKQFTHYYGHTISVDPHLVKYVADGGCGSRGLSATLHFLDGELVSVSGRFEDVARDIEEGKKA